MSNESKTRRKSYFLSDIKDYMHSERKKELKANRRRLFYARQRLSIWNATGRKLEEMPSFRIIDDDIADILIEYNIDPELYFQKLKRKYPGVTLDLIKHEKDKTRRKKLEAERLRLKSEQEKLAIMELEMNILDNLVCPVCLFPTGGKKHTNCESSIIHRMNEKQRKGSRRSIKIKRRR